MTNNQIVDAIIIDAKTKKVMSLLELEAAFEDSFEGAHEVKIEDTDYDYTEMFLTWLEMAWEDEQIEVVDATQFVITSDLLPEAMSFNKEIIL